MWALYRVDLTDPHLPVATVKSLIERLALEPMSVHRAKALGGTRWLGWGLATDYMAALLDSVNLSARASARQKVWLKDSQRAPRPAPPGPARTARSDDDAAVMALLEGL